MDSLKIRDDLEVFNKALLEYTGLIRGATNDRIGLVGDLLAEKLTEIVESIDIKTDHSIGSSYDI